MEHFLLSDTSFGENIKSYELNVLMQIYLLKGMVPFEMNLLSLV
jgi:hypothetical protein